MKNVAFVVAIGAGLIAGTASAAPLGKDVKKTTVLEADVLTPSTKHSAASLQKRLPSFDPDRSYKTAGGATITGRQYLEVVNALQAAADKAGCTLGTKKSCNFIASEAKLSKAGLERVANLATLKLALRKLPTPVKLGKVEKVEKAAKAPLGFSWSNEWGTRSRAAVYAGAEFGNDGSTSSSSCGGAAFAGVFVFNRQKEVLRLEGEVQAASTGASASVSASSELFVLGDSVWSKSGSFTATPLAFEKSFTVSKSFTYWGLITINLAAKTTASAYISGSIGGTASAGTYSCSVNMTPGVRATLGGSAEVAILGYGDISAGAVGVEADVTLADVSLPITASAAITSAGSSVKFTETLKVDLAMKYLKGSLDAYFRTVIPLDGESLLDWDNDKFTFTLIEFDGYSYNRNLFSRSAEQTL